MKIKVGHKLADVEKWLIQATLKAIPNKQEAADALGISLRTLYNRIEQYERQAIGTAARTVMPRLTKYK